MTHGLESEATDPLAGVVAPKDERSSNRAYRAYARAGHMRTGLEQFMRAIANDNSLNLRMGGYGASFTDSKNVWITPPMELGDDHQHERNLCNRYDPDGLPLCQACQVVEEIQRIAVHEIAHIVQGSFDEAELSDIDEVIEIAARKLHEAHSGDPNDPLGHLSTFEWHQKIQRAVYKARERAKVGITEDDLKRGYKSAYDPMGSHMGLSRFISPWLPGILNALEDARVNAAVHRTRPGTRRYFKSSMLNLLDTGILLESGDVIAFSDRPPNAQVASAALLVASGYAPDMDLSDYFAPEVAELMDKPDVQAVLRQVANAPSISRTFYLAKEFLKVCQSYGWMPDPEPGKAQEGPADPGALQLDMDEQDKNEDEQESGDESESSSGSDRDDSDDAEGSEDSSSDGGTDQTDPSESVQQSPDDGSPGDRDQEASASDDPEEEQPDGGDASESGDDDDTESQADSDEDTGAGDDSSDQSSVESGMESTDESGMSTGDDTTPTSAGKPAQSQDGTPAGGEVEGDGEDPQAGASGREATDRGTSLTNEEIAQQALMGHMDLKVASGHSDELDQVSTDAKVLEDIDVDELLGEEAPCDDNEKEGPNFTSENYAPSTSWSDDSPDMVRASSQSEFFRTASEEIGGVNIMKFDRLSDPAWDRRNVRDIAEYYKHLSGRNSAISDFEMYRYDAYGEYEPELIEPVARAATTVARLAFTENRAVKTTRNQKVGRLYTPTAGRKLKVGDEKVFGTKTVPNRRDYAVLLGGDVSGSTAGEEILEIKRAMYGASQLLSTLGLNFSVYFHSSAGSISGGHLDVDLFEVKSFDDPWNTDVKTRLKSILPVSANLDGHTMEVYRKLLMKQQATHRIMLYFTDGAMPAANYDEEKEVLVRELVSIKKDPNFLVLGVGIGTDSPKEYGLETVIVNGHEALPLVINKLREKLN